MTDTEKVARAICIAMFGYDCVPNDGNLLAEPGSRLATVLRAAKAAIAAMQPAPQEPVDSAAEITRLTEALRAAEEREKALREALEPFAKCCEDWISDDEDDEEWAKFRLLIKDYRRASVAMKEQGHDG